MLKGTYIMNADFNTDNVSSINRRDFIKAAALAGIPLGLTSCAGQKDYKHLPLPATNDPDFWHKLRTQFPMPPDEAYCNTGTLGAPPTRVLNSMIEHMTKHAVEIAHCDWSDGGINLLSGYFPYIDLRSKIGKLIDADYKDIALTQNATMGMNYLANGLDLPEGAEIITTDQEHPGGIKGWLVQAKRRGTVLREVPIPVPAEKPQQIIDIFEKAIGPKTRLITFSHVTSVTGTILPAKELCRLAASKGLFCIVDGAQAIGHIPVDVQDIGCDAYFAGPHKWLLAPAGSGILYICKEKIDSVWTTLASSQWDNHKDNGYRLTQRGTGNPTILTGFEAALDFHFEIGPKRIYNRIKSLGDHLRNGLTQIPRTRILTSLHPEMNSGMTTFNVAQMDGKVLQDELWNRAKLQPRSQKEKGVRYCTHIYNSFTEIDKALAIVADLAKQA